MIAACQTPFTFRQLIINNVAAPETVAHYAQKKVDAGVIDAFYFVDDYIADALKAYGLTREALGKGYYYSCSELVGIYLSKTKFHLHFSGDAFMVAAKSPVGWITEACRLLDSDPQYFVANPTWNYRFDKAKQESFGHIGNFYVGYGFSDQCYLIRAADFQAPIYGYEHELSARYPAYGGELFEKRVDAYMRTHQRLRLVSTTETYIHRNFRKSKLYRRMALWWLGHGTRDVWRFFRLAYYKHRRGI
jgi:hypothetical protein